MAPTHKVEIPALPGLVSGQNPAKPSNEQLQDESILYQTCIAISPMQAGYAADFVTITLKQHLKTILDRGIRVISNAGGLNPKACVDAINALAGEQGLTVKLACVIGDDLMDFEGSFRESQRSEMYSGSGFPERVLSINAYLGAEPIARALDQGAQIVITGRCVDSAVTLGAMMHAFGWHRSVQMKPSGA
ncbi:MAG: acyclic terpene utilization AtuA family protein, partial [Sphingomonadaceae bacterium]|nr:acyclic terpene utilization AtuA family protein [Sphingomonadaceae bacterium]